VTLLRATAVLLLALALQTGLGRLWPDAHRYVDLMYLPVIWYGIRRSQAAAMSSASRLSTSFAGA